MGSDSDWSVMQDAVTALAEFDIPFEVGVVSAHRTPGRMLDYAKDAAGRGIEVIIAGAGGAAHLPGMVAAATPLPVIGVPVPLARLDGLDSLLSIVQMPAGVPVATVSIGGARNAGCSPCASWAPEMHSCADASRSSRLIWSPWCSPRTPPCVTGCWATSRGALKLPASSEEIPMVANPSFDLFQLSDEHNELRSVLRALCEKEIAPYAAEVDAQARYTDEALAALDNNGFSAIYIPEEYGGQGADAVATCIVIEEVARVCASSSLIPICNKLGTTGLLMRGSEELKQKVLPSIAAGEATASYALSEREAGSDAGAMRTRAVADGDDWILNGSKCWISNGGSPLVHRDGGDRPGQGRQRHLGVHRALRRRGFQRRAKEHKMGIKGSPTTELYFEKCRIPGDRMIGEPGTGFKTALATLDITRPAVGAQAVGIAQGALDAAIAYTKERKQFGKAIADFQNTGFMLADMGMKVEAARLLVYTAAARAERMEPNLQFLASASKCFASDVAMEVTTNAVQLFGGYGFTTDFPVERFMRDAQDHPDLRGHQPDPAAGDVAAAAQVAAQSSRVTFSVAIRRSSVAGSGWATWTSEAPAANTASRLSISCARSASRPTTAPDRRRSGHWRCAESWAAASTSAAPTPLSAPPGSRSAMIWSPCTRTEVA
jgi:phosphoribosylaminoimidazole carboxylase PurE protein